MRCNKSYGRTNKSLLEWGHTFPSLKEHGFIWYLNLRRCLLPLILNYLSMRLGNKSRQLCCRMIQDRQKHHPITNVRQTLAEYWNTRSWSIFRPNVIRLYIRLSSIRYSRNRACRSKQYQKCLVFAGHARQEIFWEPQACLETQCQGRSC